MAKLFALGMSVLAVGMMSCGSKSSSDEPAAAADSASFTELKTIMATSCSAANCHANTTTYPWMTSETSFKAKLTTIKNRVVTVGDMPQANSGYTITAAQKAKFSAYQ